MPSRSPLVRRQWRRAAVTTAALVALTACGSTVQVSSDVPGGALGAADGLGAQPGTGTAPDGSVPGTGTATVPGALPGAPGSSVGATGGGTGTSPGGGQVVSGPGGGAAQGASAGPVPATGRGWDAKTVFIGVMTQQDVQAVAETAGVSNVDSGDQVADVNAVIGEINANGGLFGRKVVAEIVDIESAGDAETQGQAACQHFTNDRPVVAVYAMALVGDTPSFRSCMMKAQIPVLAGGGQAFDEQVFKELGGYYTLMPFPSYDPFVPYFVDRLVAQKYFTSWNPDAGAPGTLPVKTGYLCPDTPIGKRVGKIIERELARVGHPTENAIFYSTNSADVSGYVLRYKTNNVTHVLFCDLGLFVFATQAESQRYRPRYGVSTFNTPVLFLQGVVPEAQLRGSVGSGFVPALDVDAQHDPSRASMPAVAKCEAIARRGGVVYASERRFAQAVLYDTCDILQLIVASARAVGQLTGPAIAAGLGVVGPGFPSAVTWRSGLRPGVHANPSAGRDIFYDDGCSCYQYRGQTSPFR